MMLAIGVKLDGEDEQVKKRKKRSVWIKPWLKNRLRTSAYQNVFQEIRLKDNEEFRRYPRMNTQTYRVKLFICLFICFDIILRIEKLLRTYLITFL